MEERAPSCRARTAGANCRMSRNLLLRNVESATAARAGPLPPLGGPRGRVEALHLGRPRPQVAAVLGLVAHPAADVSAEGADGLHRIPQRDEGERRDALV